MGSYLAHGPEIYPKAHENPRAFSCIFDPIFLESSIQCPWGVGLHHLPWLKCIYHHMSIIWSMIFLTILLVYVDFRQRWKHRPTSCMKLRRKSHYLSSRLVGDFYVLLPFFQGFGLIMFSFPHNNVAIGFLIPTIQFYTRGQYWGIFMLNEIFNC